MKRIELTDVELQKLNALWVDSTLSHDEIAAEIGHSEATIRRRMKGVKRNALTDSKKASTVGEFRFSVETLTRNLANCHSRIDTSDEEEWNRDVLMMKMLIGIAGKVGYEIPNAIQSEMLYQDALSADLESKEVAESGNDFASEENVIAAMNSSGFPKDYKHEPDDDDYYLPNDTPMRPNPTMKEISQSKRITRTP